MRLEGNIFAGIAIFLIPITAVYWWYSRDPTGTTALIVTFGLGTLVGFYFLFTARHIDARPEDDARAEISDGAGEMGFYSPHSWWPLAVAAAGAMGFLGIVFGWWLFALAVPFFAVATFGFVFEYYRGPYAH